VRLLGVRVAGLDQDSPAAAEARQDQLALSL
jgi:hypothetical protein